MVCALLVHVESWCGTVTWLQQRVMFLVRRTGTALFPPFRSGGSGLGRDREVSCWSPILCGALWASNHLLDRGSIKVE